MTETKERPILFSGEMVRAILDGRKTVTRRVMKPQPPNGYLYYGIQDDGGAIFVDEDALSWGNNHGHSVGSPYGRPGDLLYVRETWADSARINEDRVFDKDGKDRYEIGPIYKATPDWNETWDDIVVWKPSIHMPKKYARIWLRVTAVRVERLQDITNPEIAKEGVGRLVPAKGEGSISSWVFKEPFIELWDSINAKRGYSWESNPFVWVVEFEKVDK